MKYFTIISLLFAIQSLVQTQDHHKNNILKDEDIDLSSLDTVDSNRNGVRADRRVFARKYFNEFFPSKDHKISRRQFMNLLIMIEFHIGRSMLLDFKIARYYQYLYNQELETSSDQEHIAQVLNLLEEFMNQVQETILDYEVVKNYILKDNFHHFVIEKINEIYNRSMKEYDSVTQHPQYHSEYIHADIINANNLDDRLKSTEYTDL